MRMTISVVALALAAACPAQAADRSTESGSAATSTVTRIRVNGLSSDTLLVDPDTGTNGFLNVGRDEVAGTTMLDFSYAAPTANPDVIVLVQGSGEIPGSAYTTTHTTAKLVLAGTPFPTVRCEVNINDGTFTCTDGPSVPFDLAWTLNGFSLVREHINRTETFGPLSIWSSGSYVQRSALVNGSWNGSIASNMSGNLLDTRNFTLIREITILAK